MKEQQNIPIEVTQTMWRNDTIRVECEEIFNGIDADGYPEVEYDTSSVDLQGEWGCQCISLPELLAECANALEPVNKRLADECRAWREVEYQTIIENI